MADAFLGRQVYAYCGGKSIVHLTGFTHNQSTQFVQVDPDIGSLTTISQPTSSSYGGQLSFNLTGDDFANLYDAAKAQTAIALYLYPSSTSTTTKQYLYGNAFVGTMNVTADIGGTVNGTAEWQGSDTTGFTIQTRA